MTNNHTIVQPSRENDEKWQNSLVLSYTGNTDDVRKLIPSFGRQPFGLAGSATNSILNENLETIYRLPYAGDDTNIPVGVVSKNYTLIQHNEVFDIAVKALESSNIKLTDVEAKIKITEYGERMALSFILPDNYSFKPLDGHNMALRLECINSVDGSTRFRALVGWFRFVCSNGLIIGVTQSDMRLRHQGNIELEDIGKVLSSGLGDAKSDKQNFKKWQKKDISLNHIAYWSDNEVRNGLGFKAAARALHIAATGHDATIIGQYKGNVPSSINMKMLGKVPGASTKCTNLYDLSQILAWLAKERRDIQEQMEWREKIPQLMKPLMN